MARNVSGASSIISATRQICRMVGIYGYSGINAATSNHPAFGVAVAALVAACQVWEGLDNYPGQIDPVAPAGPEDPEEV